MSNEFYNEFGVVGFAPNPARQTLVGFGYDPDSYISTAQLAPSPYVTQSAVSAKIGGLNRLIEACDDSSPPSGTLDPYLPGGVIPNPAYLTYQAVIQNTVTEINGYLSSVYPTPLAQTGTVAVIKIKSVDSVGAITEIELLDGGNYLASPAFPSGNNSPAYLLYTDKVANEDNYGSNWQQCLDGKGAVLMVEYVSTNYSDESGQVLQAYQVDPLSTPSIVNPGTGYKACQLLVLTGGTSFVPAKVRQATLDLICHSLYQRRLAPDEKNPFAPLAKMWREFFVEIGEGTKQLDGTYKRFYSAGQSWNSDSVLFAANSL